MTKKRLFVATCVLVVVLLMSAVLLACGPKYKLTFVNGEESVTVEVKKNETIAEADIPAEPTKEGYTFLGWFDGETKFDKGAKVAADATYSAKWEKNAYTLTFKDGETTVATASVEYGAKIAADKIPSDPTKEGYRFDGWFNGKTKFDKEATVKADATYVAKYTINSYTLTFKDGETTVATASVEYGAKIAADKIPSDPTKEGYRFDGWFNGETKFDKEAAVKADATYTAKYTKQGAEKGTYTGAQGNLVLDGYGAAKLGETDVAYTVEGNVVTIGANKYKLVVTEESSTYIVYDGIEGTYSYTSWGATTTLVFDGYGVVIGNDGYGEEETGSYTVSEGELTMDFTGTALASALNLTLEIRENGNVLYLEDPYGDLVILKEGYVVPTEGADAFAGLWIAEDGTVLEITVEEAVPTVKENGVEIEGAAFNYNYTKLNVPIPASWYSYNYTVVDGTLVRDGEVTFTATTADQIDVTVKFVYGEEVTTINIKYGQAITAAYVPEDPTVEDPYAFSGWYNGNDAFDIEAVEETLYYANVTYTAEIEQAKAIVVFKNGEETVSTIYRDFGSKLAASDIPAAPSKENSFFLGWYKGSTKAEDAALSGLTITFEAKFNSAADYTGAFADTTNGESVIFNADGSKATFMGERDIAVSYDATTGKIIYSAGSLTAKVTYEMFIGADGNMTLTYTAWDAVEEQFVPNSYTLKKATGAINGVFKKDNSTANSSIMNVTNGVIDTANYYYCYATVSGKNMILKYRENKNSSLKSSGIIRNAITRDEDDNILYFTISDVTGSLNGIWFANVTDAGSYYNSETTSTLFKMVAGETTYFVYQYKNADSKDVYALAAFDKDFAEGQELTMTCDGKTLIVQCYDGTLDIAGEERGTYTNASDGITAYLDGFDAISSKGADGENITMCYAFNAAGAVLIYDENAVGMIIAAIKIDSENKTFEILDQDVDSALYVNDANANYELLIDGFGGATLAYKSSYGSPNIYAGTYTVSADGKTITIAKTSYPYNGAYSIEYGGKVLVKTDGKQIFKTEDAVIENKVAEMAGYYVNGEDKIEIVVDESKNVKLYVNGTLTDCKLNWNGTTITYKGKDVDAGVEGWKDNTVDYVISKDVDNIIVSHDCHAKWDEYMEGPEFETKTVTYTASTKPEEPVVLDKFAGTWECGSLTFTFDGVSVVTNEDGRSFAYTVGSDGKAKFSDGTNDIVCTLTDSGMNAYYDDGENQFSKDFTKKAEATTDAFAGTWKPESLSILIVINGDGTATWDGNAFTYTVDGEQAKFSYGYANYVVTFKGEKLHFESDDTEFMPTFDAVKQA